LPKDLQFSRAIIGLGSAWAMGVLFAIRLIAQYFKIGDIHLTSDSEKRVIVVGTQKEAERIQQLLNKSQVDHKMLCWVFPKPDKQDGFVGGIHQLSEIIEIYKANLVIFSGKDVQAAEIMKTMADFAKSGIQLKIAPDKGESIIGSSSKNDPGELFTIEVKYALAELHQQRRKRIFDLLFSLVLIFLSPLLLILGLAKQSIFVLYKNLLQVLFGFKTWVSYNGSNTATFLPKLKNGVFKPSGNWTNTTFEGNVNHLYAKEFRVTKDIQTILTAVF
jgi:hypothetical protein